MKFALPVVLLIAILAFVAGISVKSFLLAPFKSATDKQEKAQSANLTQESPAIPALSGESAPVVSTHDLNGQTYTSQTTTDKIVISGDFSMSSYKLHYIFNLPKTGGDITGNISGSCEGTLTGKADTPNSSGEAKIKGQYSADCKVILGFKTKALGTFEGNVKYKEGKAEVDIVNNEPIKQSGSIELLFIP